MTKAVNPADRRLVTLELTDAGRAMVGEIAPLARAFEDEVLAELGANGPGFRTALARLIERDKGAGRTTQEEEGEP